MKIIQILIISLFLFITSNAQNLDSLKKVILNSADDSTYFYTLKKLSSAYLKNKNIDSAIISTNEMFSFSKLKKNKRYLTFANLSLTDIYDEKGMIDSSIFLLKNYSKTLTINDTLDLAEVNWGIGYRYYLQGNNIESLIYYLKAANSYELIGNPLKVYDGLRYGYSRIGEREEALKYTNKMLEVCPDTNYSVLSGIYLNKGFYEIILKKYVESFESSKKSLEIHLNVLNDSVSHTYGLVHSNIAGVYLYVFENCPDSIRFINPYMKNVKESDLKQLILDSAKYSLDQYYDVYINGHHNLFDVYRSYGQWYLIQNNIKKALFYFIKSYQTTLGNRTMYMDRRDVSYEIFKIYKAKQNYAKSLYYYEDYISLKDSLNDEEKQREVGKQEAKFEFDKQEAQEEAQRAKQKVIDDAKLAKQKAVARIQEKNQRIVTYSIALGLILISIFTVLIFRRLRIAKAQQVLIKAQKKTIEKNRNHMLESIEYSKNIQLRIFPTFKEVKELLPNSFLYFKPKDVVSGDFYWVHHKGNKTYFSVADCTGHGVPGAFMTLISLNLINSIILEDDINSTSSLLERLHVRLKERLTSSEEEQMKHGLDIAMCAYNHDTNELEFSGLHNPIYIINKEHELREIKGDNLFLGISSNFNVTNHIIPIKSGDTVYLSTDGFPDQKGGERGKKYYSSRLRNTLRIVDSKPLNKRRLILDQKFEAWKGDIEQIDDICIMGVSF